MPVQSKPKYEIKVYKIWYEDDPDEFYIGSTKHDALSKRMSMHRRDAKKGKKSKIYQTIREKGGDFKYIQIASCMVSCKDEQCAFEQEWIDRLNPTLNMMRAHGRDIERYKQYEQSPEYKQKRKEYENIPERKEKRNECRDNKRRTCVCGVEYVASPYYSQRHYDTEKHRTFIAVLPFPFNGGLHT